MNRLANLLTGAGLGAGLMFFRDPNLGKRRRSLLRDQFVHALSKTDKGIDTTWRDLQNRAYGTIAKLRNCLAGSDASDEVLVDRVRSKMGRHVSHPASINVAARDGVVTLSGPVLVQEVDDLLCAVKSVRGVRDIEAQLEVHQTAENFSVLHGCVPRTGEPAKWNQQHWSPTARLIAGAAGAALMANCAMRRTALSPLTGAVGFGLCLRALTNVELTRLFGIGSGRRGIDVQKTIIIGRPVDEVFELLADPNNYPQFSDMVASVRDLGDGRYQETLRGPGGAELSVVERITRRVPNAFVACRSEPDSPLQYAGRARFIPLGNSRTKVEIDATYHPPGGVLGHSAAWLAQMDLKRQLDDVLMRAKAYLETGRQPHDAQAVQSAAVNESRLVDEASEESFPASDAPSYTGSSATRSDGPGSGERDVRAPQRGSRSTNDV